MLRESFAERGRVESMLIPHDMPEHRYYEDLENRLVMYEPENRVSPEQFAKLAAKVAEHRERAGPRPVDPAPYL